MTKISISLQAAQCIGVYLLAGKNVHFFAFLCQSIHLSSHLLTPLIITSFFRLMLPSLCTQELDLHSREEKLHILSRTEIWRVWTSFWVQPFIISGN